MRIVLHIQILLLIASLLVKLRVTLILILRLILKWNATIGRMFFKGLLQLSNFLQRGLAFCGQDEIVGSCNNGNFVGLIELLSQFDPFLASHIYRYGNMTVCLPPLVTSLFS